MRARVGNIRYNALTRGFQGVQVGGGAFTCVTEVWLSAWQLRDRQLVRSLMVDVHHEHAADRAGAWMTNPHFNPKHPTAVCRREASSTILRNVGTLVRYGQNTKYT